MTAACALQQEPQIDPQACWKFRLLALGIVNQKSILFPRIRLWTWAWLLSNKPEILCFQSHLTMRFSREQILNWCVCGLWSVFLWYFIAEAELLVGNSFEVITSLFEVFKVKLGFIELRWFHPIERFFKLIIPFIKLLKGSWIPILYTFWHITPPNFFSTVHYLHSRFWWGSMVCGMTQIACDDLAIEHNSAVPQSSANCLNHAIS